MGDLAKRPRGGWQVGGRIRRREVLPEHDQDVFSVEWKGDKARVTHFDSRTSTTACCRPVVVKVTDEDRAQAFDYEDQKGSTAALRRAADQIEAQHQRGQLA